MKTYHLTIQGDTTFIAEEDGGARTPQKEVYTEDVMKAMNHSSQIETPFLPGKDGIRKYFEKDGDVILLYTKPLHQRRISFTDREGELVDDAIESLQGAVYQQRSLNDEDRQEAFQAIESLQETLETRAEEADEDELEGEDFIPDEDYEYLNLNLDVAVPHTAMIVVMRKQEDHFQHINTYMYATRYPILTGDEQVYAYPFGNVYPDHNICWGESIEPLTVLAAPSLFDRFFHSHFNRDLLDVGNDDIDLRTIHPSLDDCYMTPNLFLLNVLMDKQLKEGKDANEVAHFAVDGMQEQSGHTVLNCFESIKQRHIRFLEETRN